jgi:glycine/D-amino acid oxidase-like deaminating enzyme
MKKTDFEIVGWGIAGATMAWQMYFSKNTFMVFDSTTNYSSRTAAGIINPIVFKRLTKSWQADSLIPYAELFYRRVEKTLTAKVIEPKNIYKVFTTIEDENEWLTKQVDNRFEQYLDSVPAEDKIGNVTAKFGYGVVKTIGNLNTKKYLELSKAFFLEQGIEFRDEKFDFESFDDKKSKYKNESVKNIIFCEGYDVLNNPYFKYLPLKPTHGETLIIETEDFNFEHILSKNIYVVPLGGNKYKVGATNNWKIKEAICTDKGKEEIIEKLEKFTDFKYKIVSQEAGIRPTVSDRRPLIGTHPNHKKLHIFNGLGTKGVMIAPFYSERLINAIEGDFALDHEVDIVRYEKFLNQD